MDISSGLKDLSVEEKKDDCRIDDLSKKPNYSDQSLCPFHKTIHKPLSQTRSVNSDIRFDTRFGSYEATKGTKKLLKDIGGGDMIHQMTTRFYAHTFLDETLSKFMFEKVSHAPTHGQRIGDWIIEKMGGEGEPWTESGRDGMRQVSHRSAWTSPKRERERYGEHFQLDDCRIWMRLMFWSAREIGLDQHKYFMNWYVNFIGHFMEVYERTAPPYAKTDADWSKNTKNIETYVANGYVMKDVIGIGRR